MRVAVLGAGISGLVAAWTLQKRGVDVVIVERQERVGGWIQTERRGGFLCEEGPRGFRPKGAGKETLLLARELGLAGDILPADGAAKRRFVWAHGRLQSLPTHPLGFWRSSLTRTLPFTLWKEWRTPSIDPAAEESIDAFARRRFGDYTADYLIDPLVSGIFAGDATTLSLRSCFPALWDREQQHGSIARSLWRGRKGVAPPQSAQDPWLAQWAKVPLATFRAGMAELPRTLQQKLHATWLLGRSVAELRPLTGGVEVVLDDGHALIVDHVLSTLPAKALGMALQGVSREVAALLAEIKGASVAVVQMGFSSDVLPKRGFGYLIPTKERQEILGMVWDSSVFPQQNTHSKETRLTVMVGGAHHPEVACYGEDAIARRALAALRCHLGIDKEPDVIAVSMAREAIPQYALGHQGRIASIRERLAELSPRITACGMSFDGVAVNDCIAAAKRHAEQLVV